MSQHVHLETLAALAEGTLPRKAAARVHEHLAGCRTCAAAYVDAVRYRAAWLANPDAFETSATESRKIDRALRTAFGERPGTATWLLAAAALAVVAMAGFWVGSTGRGRSTSLALPPAVRAAAESASSRGLVLPGGARLAASPVQEMRSGTPELAPGLEDVVNALLDAYERGRGSADDAARVVTALLAVNDLSAARDYAREGLSRHPHDVRLLVLMADVSYRADELAQAESLLRQARRHAAGDPMVALDLALVLRRRGDGPEAATLFERVARSNVRPLAERAARELQTGR